MVHPGCPPRAGLRSSHAISHESAFSADIGIMIKTDDIIRQIDDLEPIPKIAHQIIAEAAEPEASVAELIAMVEYEPAITANLLKICNSAYFGLAGPIETVRHAVSLLGINQVVEIILLSASSKPFKNRSTDAPNSKMDLWHHSIISAVIARTMAQMLGYENRQLVFTGALLKDIGRVILDRHVESYSTKIAELTTNENYSIVAAEKKILGTDHAAVGALIADKWQFSPSLTFIIANHHLTTAEAMNDLATAIVYLSDSLTLQFGSNADTDWAEDFFNASLIESLKLSPKDLHQLQIQCWEIQDKVEGLVFN